MMRASPALPHRPLLHGLYHVIRLGPDSVQVSNAGRHVVLSGEGLGDVATPLLSALDGTATLDQLAERFPDVVPSLLEGLWAKGLLTDAAPDRGQGDGDPSELTAFALANAGSPAEVAARLTGATVAVVGCGPVGGALASLLAKAGVGRLVLADAGTASARDVAVSPVLVPGDTGSSLAEATHGLCLRAGAVAPDVVPTPVPRSVLAALDLAIVEDSYDSEEPARVADMCLRAGVPYLLHGQDALRAMVGPLVGPGGAPCHRCFNARRLSHVAHLEAHLSYRRHRAACAPQADAFLAAHCSAVAGLLATESMKALFGSAPFGSTLIIDLAAMTTSREQVFAVPGCTSCASSAVGDAERPR